MTDYFFDIRCVNNFTTYVCKQIFVCKSFGVQQINHLEHMLK